MIEYTIPANRILHSAKVDFSHRAVNKAIHVVQYDKQMPLIAVELNLSSESYAVPAGMEVKVRWSKPDNTFIYKDVLGSNADRTVVYFDVDEQMSFFAGSCDPIIELYVSETEKAGSSPIPIVIDKNPIQLTDIYSENDYPVLQQAVIDAQQAVSDAQDEVALAAAQVVLATAQANLAAASEAAAAVSAAEALASRDELNNTIVEVNNITKKNTIQDVQIATIEETLRKSVNGEVSGEVSGYDIIDLPERVAPGSPLRFGMKGLTEGINKVAYVNKTIDEVIVDNGNINDVVYEGFSLADIFETNDISIENDYNDDINLNIVTAVVANGRITLEENAGGNVYVGHHLSTKPVIGTRLYTFTRIVENTLDETVNYGGYSGSSPIDVSTTFFSIGVTGFVSRIDTTDQDVSAANPPQMFIFHSANAGKLVLNHFGLVDLGMFSVEPSQAELDTWALAYLKAHYAPKEFLTYRDIFGDSSFGVGRTNKFSNGDFTNGTVGWSVTAGTSISVVNGMLEITKTIAGLQGGTQSLSEMTSEHITFYSFDGKSSDGSGWILGRNNYNTWKLIDSMALQNYYGFSNSIHNINFYEFISAGKIW